jgi:hypothetical protein
VLLLLGDYVKCRQLAPAKWRVDMWPSEGQSTVVISCGLAVTMLYSLGRGFLKPHWLNHLVMLVPAFLLSPRFVQASTSTKYILKSDVWLPGHIEMPVRLFMSTTPHY